MTGIVLSKSDLMKMSKRQIIRMALKWQIIVHEADVEIQKQKHKNRKLTERLMEYTDDVV